MDWLFILNVSVQILIFGLLITGFVVIAIRELNKQKWIGTIWRGVLPENISKFYDQAAARAVRFANAIYSGLDQVGAAELNAMVDYGADYLESIGVKNIKREFLKKLIAEILATGSTPDA